MNLSDKELLMLEANIKFGTENLYEIKDGSLGRTLYIESPTRAEATKARALVPLRWKDLYTVVLCSGLVKIRRANELK